MPFQSRRPNFILKIWNNAFDFFNGLIRKVSRNDRYFWTLTSVFLLFAIPLTVFTVLEIRDLRSSAATLNSPCYFINASGVYKSMDVTGDYHITVDDVNAVSAHFYLTGYSIYDINSDGIVGIADMLAVEAKVPTTCYPTIGYFLTSADTINSGLSVTLSWTTQFVTSVTLNGASVNKTGSQTFFPTTSTTYTLVVLNPLGIPTSSSIPITVTQPPPPTATVDIKAAPPGGVASDGPISIAYNAAASLSWTSANASSCVASGSWTNSNMSVSSTGYSTGNLTSTPKTYTLACRNSAGTLGPSNSVVVNVGAAPPLPPPTATVDIKAKIPGTDSYLNGPINIAYNTSALLKWTTSNASSCDASGDWSGSKGTSGSEVSTGNLISPKTYTLTCKNSLGTTGPPDSVVVNVAGEIFPTVNISADNPNLSYNSSTTIRWSATNADTCVVSATGTTQTWSGANSSHSTGNLTQSRTYTASCTKTGQGTKDRSVPVNVAEQGCLINCTPTPVQPPANHTPTAPRVVPRGSSSQPAATSDDIKLNFSSNDFLQGPMEVTIKINDTTFSQKASLNKEGGTFVLSPKGIVTKNKAYVLQLSSINSLVQKVGFTYSNNTSVDIAAFVTGDFNSDNSIDGNDLGILTETGILSGDSFYDINYDGVVNSVDYSLLLINQGKKGS